MTDPEAFYNREDLWTVASEVGMSEGVSKTTQTMPAEFRPDETAGENQRGVRKDSAFTPANRNNLIGWIAGRSDRRKYGTSMVYDFPKRSLSTGRYNRGANRSERAASGQLTLWNSARLARAAWGRWLVIPSGRALLYAETDLPAGRAESDAGVASGRARTARSACLRTNLRVGDAALFGGAFHR